MTFRKYLRYFLFIASNWNYLLAFFTLRHEIRGERKYGLDTTELIDIHKLPIRGNNLDHASNYQAANYFLLEKAFSYLQSIQANASLLDFGCGKGRVMAVAAHFGFKQIKGVDFADELIRQAEYTLGPVKEKFPLVKFKLYWDDAANIEIEKEDEVFFFFNPFDETVMLSVVKNILSSLKKFSRRVFVVYLNPLHKEIFLSAGFEEEYYLRKLEYLELSIMTKDPMVEEY